MKEKGETEKKSSFQPVSERFSSNDEAAFKKENGKISPSLL
ncbi:hypothetical protein P4S88_02385 [Anoxybacillus geothermalis]|nr:hypothetical protein [Anoxybacillus geothermalis]